MPAPAEIVQLVELFQRNYGQYGATAFTEAAVHYADARPARVAGRGGGTRTIPKGAALQRRIKMTDRRIDRPVYDLYELTEEEIKVVEGGATDRNE